MIVWLDGGCTTAEGWTGLVVGLNPQYSHPVCMTTKLEHSCNSQQFQWIHRNVGNRNFMNMRKMHMGNFSMGMSEIQMFQMNQSHNDDVMNVNG